MRRRTDGFLSRRGPTIIGESDIRWRQLNDMRGVFGTRPYRSPEDPCCVVAVQNFKGGVGKSTLAVHLAQYLAIRGYRVALIDCDSQASATTLFGYVPDLDLDEDDTLYPFLREGERTSLDYALRKTHFDGLELIPANLRLFQSEYELAARMARGSGALLDRLREGIESISDRFDVIVMDPPPRSGRDLALSAARGEFAGRAGAADGDGFLLDRGFSVDAGRDDRTAGRARPGAELRFLRFVASKVDENKSMQKELSESHADAVRPRDGAYAAQGLGRNRQCDRSTDDGLRA